MSGFVPRKTAATSTASSDFLYVGNNNTGMLNLTNGGQATSTGNIYLGAGTGSGTVTVGSGSTLSGLGIYVGGNISAAGGTGFLGGTGTVTASGPDGVRVYSTGMFSPGDAPGAVGTLGIDGNLDLRGATLAVDIDSATSFDQLVVTSNVVFDSNVNTLAVNGLGPVAYDKYTFLTTTTGAVSDPTGKFNATLDGYNLMARGSVVDREADHKSLYLQLAFNNIALTWTGAESDIWTNDPSTANSGNWASTAGTPLETKFRDGDSGLFSAGNPATIDISNNVTVAGMTVNGGTTNTFTGSGDITGSTSQSTGLTATGKLNVTDSSKVVFANSGTNAFGGGTEIGKGSTVQIGNGNSTGALSGGIINDGTLDINRSDDYTLDNAISGTGTTKISGTGKLTISGTQPQVNDFVQSAGTVILLKPWGGNYIQSDKSSGVLTSLGTGDGRINGNATIRGTLNGLAASCNMVMVAESIGDIFTLGI